MPPDQGSRRRNLRTSRVAPPPFNLTVDEGVDLTGIADHYETRREVGDQLKAVVRKLEGFIDNLKVEHCLAGVDPAPFGGVADGDARLLRDVAKFLDDAD